MDYYWRDRSLSDFNNIFIFVSKMNKIVWIWNDNVEEIMSELVTF